MPSALRQRAIIGNVTAMEQSGPEKLEKMFPCPLEDLPQIISVVLLCAAENEDHLKAMVARARALRVRLRRIATSMRCSRAPSTVLMSLCDSHV